MAATDLAASAVIGVDVLAHFEERRKVNVGAAKDVLDAHGCYDLRVDCFHHVFLWLVEYGPQEARSQHREGVAKPCSVCTLCVPV